jgi:hypothetical protein
LPYDPVGRPYRSFRGLLDHLATLTRDQVRFAGATASVPMLTEPTSTQRQAFELIGTAIPLTLNQQQGIGDGFRGMGDRRPRQGAMAWPTERRAARVSARAMLLSAAPGSRLLAVALISVSPSTTTLAHKT